MFLSDRRRLASRLTNPQETVTDPADGSAVWTMHYDCLAGVRFGSAVGGRGPTNRRRCQNCQYIRRTSPSALSVRPASSLGGIENSTVITAIPAIAIAFRIVT